MPNTTRQQIWYPDGNTQFNPFQNLFSTMATSVDNAITKAGNTRVASAAARTTAFPSPVSGDSVFRTDMQWIEGYFTSLLWGPNGWYPTSGRMPYLDGAVMTTNTIPTGTWTAKAGMNLLETSGPNAVYGGFTFGSTNVFMPYSGRYNVSAVLQYSGNSSGGTRAAKFMVGTREYGASIGRSLVTSSALQINISSEIAYAAGEGLQVQCLHDAAASLQAALVSLTINYLGPI